VNLHGSLAPFITITGFFVLAVNVLAPRSRVKVIGVVLAALAFALSCFIWVRQAI
jgi:hypothetical protein